MHSFPFNPLDRFYGTTSSSSGTSSTKGHQRLRGRAFDFCSFLMRKKGKERRHCLFNSRILDAMVLSSAFLTANEQEGTRPFSLDSVWFDVIGRNDPPPHPPKRKKRPISWEVQLNGGGNRISEHQHQSGFPSLIIDYQRCPSIDTQDPTTFLWSSRLKRLHFFFNQ